MFEELTIAREKLNQGVYTFILMNNDLEICRTERGIAPLYETFQQNKANLKDAFLADKVIGRAASILSALGGVKAISTPLATQGALKVCEQYGIFIQADKVVEHILNRTQTDLCPIEKLAVGCDNFEELPELIAGFFASIKK